MNDTDPKTVLPQDGAHSTDYEDAVQNELLEADVFEIQPLVAQHLDAMPDHYRGSDIEIFLKSFWEFAEGLQLSGKSQLMDAKTHFDSAAQGFEAISLQEPYNLARAMGTYVQAGLEAQQRNFTTSMTLFEKAASDLKDAGRYEKKFRLFIDQMQPEHLMIAAVNSQMVGDFEMSDSLLFQATKAARYAATTYYHEESDGYMFFQGLGDYTQAFLDFSTLSRFVLRLDLDRLPALDDQTKHAALAHQKLSTVDTQSFPNAPRLAGIADCLYDYMQAEHAVLGFLKACLQSTFKPDAISFAKTREAADRARTKAAMIGKMGIPIIRQCEQLRARINNLERLAMPTTSDFGIYSGLISCALFAVLFFIIAWANQTYALGLDGPSFFLTVIALSLIGGFGYGAVHFKGFVFQHGKSAAK